MTPGSKPRGEFAGKSAAISTRLTPACRSAVETSSKRSGRSLSQELEFLLWQGMGVPLPKTRMEVAAILRSIADDVDGGTV